MLSSGSLSPSLRRQLCDIIQSATDVEDGLRFMEVGLGTFENSRG